MRGNSTQKSRVFVGPDAIPEVVEAVEAGGSTLAGSLSNADAVVWFGRDPAELDAVLPQSIRWLQVPDAGVDKWIDAGFLDRGFVVTSAAGVYGGQVAEHAMALVLACVHQIATYARAESWDPQAAHIGSLGSSQVTVIGAGGIGTALIALLRPFGCSIVAVTRSGRMVPGADLSVGSDGLDTALASADIVVLAAPSTAQTLGLINARTLDLMKSTAALLNVARGNLIDSEALLAALDRGRLSAVALDVTDPEPLPDGHPFFHHPKILITPHVANPAALKRASFAQHVRDNCQRFNSGETLSGVVDSDRGY
jgi:phosphoglycerate dehydrogenase-like enzyme